MCMSLRIEPSEMAKVLVKIRKMSLAQEMSKKLGKSLTMFGDLYPADIAPVLAPNKYGNMAIFPMVWGFTHKSTPKPLVNCRVETADSKPLWRDSWYRRSCVIPASWYYEWGYPVYEDDSRSMVEHRNTKNIKFAIQTEGSNVTYIAGLYRYEEHCDMQVPVFSVLTKEAAGTVRDIHDRMPLILDKEDVKEWIRQ
ncbi:SOS response-associated peptidase family protein [Ruminococcus flavefaciens]|uniref:SOS response-associated peptidase family protein n=1 Tax=Ruminococcus flavefaciens TaxID=1265 RepID=UPI0026ED1CB2|nr:SOS response-associated peptidase family protein [Ruminococcus flavefaciens]MDD7516462.1 SOS response-associated peptidase family protein [Ruminococcus flavefaciens]MDY5690929.1 SOS response-associated peptidase family protein [Ruminococcus flavefaciens]